MNELRTKYDDFYREAESVIREKEKIAGVLLQAQEKAENMMVEARKSIEGKVHLINCLNLKKKNRRYQA